MLTKKTVKFCKYQYYHTTIIIQIFQIILKLTYIHYVERLQNSSLLITVISLVKYSHK